MLLRLTKKLIATGAWLMFCILFAVWGFSLAGFFSLILASVCASVALNGVLTLRASQKPKTLEADPIKVKELEDELGLSLPELDDDDIRLMVQQVADATGLTEKKTIEYVANDLGKTFYQVLHIFNPVEAVEQALENTMMMGEPQSLVTGKGTIHLLDASNNSFKHKDLPHPSKWKYTGEINNNGRHYTCDAIEFEVDGKYIPYWDIRIGNIRTEKIKTKGQGFYSRYSIKPTLAELLYNELCRQYAYVPTEERHCVRHHLQDCCWPSCVTSVADPTYRPRTIVDDIPF